MVVENTVKEYTVNDKGQYSCQYYVTFCTKFNRRIFTDEYVGVLYDILKSIEKSKGFDILDIIIAPDVVQCIINCSPEESIQKCVNQMKIAATKQLHEECPELKSRMPQMWTKKNFISSMGDVTYNSVSNYIESQRKE